MFTVCTSLRLNYDLCVCCTASHQEASIAPSCTFHAVNADLRCAPLTSNHSLNAHIEWIEYAARHHRHVQVAIDDEKQKRMINRDLYGLRLGAGVAWPEEGSSYCTFILAVGFCNCSCSWSQHLDRNRNNALRLNASRCAATDADADANADAAATYASVD